MVLKMEHGKMKGSCVRSTHNVLQILREFGCTFVHMYIKTLFWCG
jgi:hypothetical protein